MASATRLKHIDLRAAWVRQMRDRSVCEFVKIAGTENPADFFTKLLPGTAFAEAAKTIMKPQPSARGRLLDKSEVGEPSPVADGGTGASKAVPAKKAM